MKEEKPIESQLFDWGSWEQFDTAGFIFIDVTLKRDLEPFKAGDRFHCANIDYEHSRMELIKDQESKEGHVFSLSITAKLSGLVTY